MSTSPLQYEPVSERPWWPRLLSWKLAAVAGAIVIALLVPSVPLRHVESRMDPVTGSMRWQTTWWFGIKSAPRVDVSPLERQLLARGVPWTRSWQFLHYTGRDFWGNATSFQCGDAPEIHGVRTVLAPFAAAATDPELREFVRVMQTGTGAEQMAALEAAAERAFNEPSTAPSAGF